MDTAPPAGNLRGRFRSVPSKALCPFPDEPAEVQLLESAAMSIADSDITIPLDAARSGDDDAWLADALNGTP